MRVGVLAGSLSAQIRVQSWEQQDWPSALFSKYRKLGEKLLGKTGEITGVQKSDGASECQRQAGMCSPVTIAQCLISACANPPLGVWEEHFRYLVFAVAVCVSTHETSVAF